MTMREAGQILTIMQTVYPDSFRGQSDEALSAMVRVWAQIFADESFDDVANAVYAHMATSTDKFMPVPGTIKAKLHDIANPDAMTEDEAWRIIARALRNGIYGSREEFDKLPAELRKIVHDPAQLKEWAKMDEETVQSVVVSNFRRSYRVTATRRKELDMLPQDVRAAISSTVGRMRLE